MKATEQEAAAKKFADAWKDKGDEKQDSQRFWIELLQKVYGVEDPAIFVRFETRVKLSHTSFIDVMIPATHTMIEQKGRGIDLEKPIRQSDGTFLKPSEQAKRYAAALPYSDRPRWIVTCNFRQFQVFDMDRPNDAPQIIELADLPKEYYRLQFMVDVKDSHITKEMEISKDAGDLVGRLYKALYPLYLSASQLTEEKATEYLNKLCVRLVFCLYAEDAGIFGRRNMFHDYLDDYRPQHFSKALSDLFKVLDQKPEERDPFLEEGLAQFPYVNGSLFRENVPVPPMNEEVRRLILEDACGFDWSQISPTIFGAIFEDTLNSGMRRAGGMHYTSIENIHKVIDPLFLDDYKKKFQNAMQEKTLKRRTEKLKALQNELARGKYLDPACGSGNFLTESYLSLRRLENDILRETITDATGTGVLDFGEAAFDPIKVSIQQFYGIEINDFAVSVAKTAIWIAESQMMKETESIIQRNMDFLPLHTNANIHEGNALRMDWKEVLPPSDDVKIMGNPPFVGASMMTKEQKAEAVAIFGKGKRIHSIDYVGAWYYKAAEYMQGKKIKAAFVSTNSITQGEQVSALWDKLLNQYHVKIIFAYRTFRWNSESNQKAHVHCVIIGFACYDFDGSKFIFNDKGNAQLASNINPYLMDGPDILINSIGHSICGAKRITAGNKPADGGNLLLSEDEREKMLKDSPDLGPCIRRYIGSRDYINGKPIRYCLWLRNVPPTLYCKNKEVIRRLQAVKKKREESSAAPTRAMAEKPQLFFSAPQTDEDYLCIPEVSSERRRYIPIGFLDKSVIASNKLLIVPGATLYDFGILISNVHMAWMRMTAGRLEMRYQYSGSNVYNTFPWPHPTENQRKEITLCAQRILEAREKYPSLSLADMYGETMFLYTDLLEAHRANDRAVMRAYGFSLKMTEADCIAALMKMYQDLTAQEETKTHHGKTL